MSENYSEILERMQTEFEKNAGYVPDDASDIGIRMKTLAGEIFSLESSIDFLKRQMFPTTATGEYLDKHTWGFFLQVIHPGSCNYQLLWMHGSL